MSHELRTPLQGILGYTDLLIEESQDDSFQKECLGAIRSSTNHLISLVNDLLDLSNFVAGRMELHKSPTELMPIIRDALSMVSPNASKKSIEDTKKIESSNQKEFENYLKEFLDKIS